jgi:hypothetical protein
MLDGFQLIGNSDHTGFTNAASFFHFFSGDSSNSTTEKQQLSCRVRAQTLQLIKIADYTTSRILDLATGIPHLLETVS